MGDRDSDKEEADSGSILGGRRRVEHATLVRSGDRDMCFRWDLLDVNQSRVADKD